MTLATVQEEKKDILTVLSLCERFNPEEPMKLKQSAHAISQRVHHAENYDFLNYIRRSPNPAGALKRELNKPSQQTMVTGNS